MPTRLGLLVTVTATIAAATIIVPANVATGAAVVAIVWLAWALYLWRRPLPAQDSEAPPEDANREFWHALMRACALARRQPIPVTLLLLRSQDPAALMVALGPELRASDMVAHAPAGAVAVLLHDTADEGARLFIERARAGYPAYVQYGYAWTDGNSGPMGLYRVAQEMLLANERVPTPVARAS